MARSRPSSRTLANLGWVLRSAAGGAIRAALAAGRAGAGVISSAVGAIYETLAGMSPAPAVTRQQAYESASLEYQSQKSAATAQERIDSPNRFVPPVPITAGAAPGYATNIHFQGVKRPGQEPETIYHTHRSDNRPSIQDLRDAAAAVQAEIARRYGVDESELPDDIDLTILSVTRGAT